MARARNSWRVRASSRCGCSELMSCLSAATGGALTDRTRPRAMDDSFAATLPRRHGVRPVSLRQPQHSGPASDGRRATWRTDRPRVTFQAPRLGGRTVRRPLREAPGDQSSSRSATRPCRAGHEDEPRPGWSRRPGGRRSAPALERALPGGRCARRLRRPNVAAAADDRMRLRRICQLPGRLAHRMCVSRGSAGDRSRDRRPRANRVRSRAGIDHHPVTLRSTTSCAPTSGARSTHWS